MYLTCALRQHSAEHGYEVRCLKPGPDVLVECQGHRIWVEAITVTDGDPSRHDAPIERNREEPGQIPDEQILLRYANAIDAKHQKFQDYRNKGIINAADSYVIALNAFPLTFRWAEPEIPRFLKALFPLGPLQFIFDKQTMELIERRHKYRSCVFKKSGASVSTTAFLDNRCSGISGVLHSYANPCMKRTPLGLDFLLAHNPLADQPIPLGLLPSDREYSAKLNEDDCELTCHPGQLS